MQRCKNDEARSRTQASSAFTVGLDSADGQQRQRFGTAALPLQSCHKLVGLRPKQLPVVVNMTHSIDMDVVAVGCL
jgi:hypothetical protein